MPQEELDRLRDYYTLYGQYDKDGKPVGLLQRATPSSKGAVPEGWHPHQLRDKPADPDPERDAEIAKHSAVAIIDAIVQRGGATESTPVD